MLLPGDAGAAYILALPAGIVFEGFHRLFFGYVFARLLIAAMQLVAAGGLILRHSRRALAAQGPWPYLPVGVGMIVAVSILCVAVYLRIYHQGGSFPA